MYFKVLFTKKGPANFHFLPNLIAIIGNYDFVSSVHLLSYSNKKEYPYTRYKDLNYGNYW